MLPTFSSAPLAVPPLGALLSCGLVMSGPVSAPARPELQPTGQPATSVAVAADDSRPLWELVLELLPPKDASTEWFDLAEIAPLLGITPHALSKHARDLWPEHEGHWRLNFSQATALIRRVCYAGRKKPKRSQVLEQLARREASPRGEAAC